MNKTKIDWTDMTWNPITGCFHDCEYCYARKIARRFEGASETHHNECVGSECQWYTEEEGEIHDLTDPVYDFDRGHKAPYPFGFDPTFHRYRLDDPKRKKEQQTIFVCSMADLFGEWVPEEWIRAVFKACESSPQHRYLFLTKNASRTAAFDDEFKEHKNWWCGTSVTNQESEYNLAQMSISANRFISIEPICEPIEVRNRIRMPFADWVIVGAETGNRKGKVIPEKAWIDNIVRVCKENDIPVFMKDSLRLLMGDEFIQEFPWNKTNC